MFKALPIILLSAATTLSASQDELLMPLQAMLDEASEIATQKLMNVDYLPSVVTVVKADKLRSVGAQNVAEALDLLPGFQVHLSPMGYPMVTVRGFKNPNAYLSDKIKLMIDGVSVNNEMYGTAYYYMDFPMEMVDRIEVLRGPASTIHGAGAFYGAVNVITKSGEGIRSNQGYMRAGSYDYALAGTSLYHTRGDWTFFGDAYFQFNNKQLDFVKGKNDWFPREELTDEAFSDHAVGFTAKNGGFTLQARYKRSIYGNFYGFEGKLDEATDQTHNNTHFLAKAAYKGTLENGWGLQTHLLMSEHSQDVGARLEVAYGSKNNKIVSRFAEVGVEVDDGFITNQQTTERTYDAALTLRPPLPDAHDLSLSIGARTSKVTRDALTSNVENWIYSNWETITTHPNYTDFYYYGEPALNEAQTFTLLNRKAERTTLFASIQELYTFQEDLDFTFGLRMDDYSDFGTKTSARAGLVWRAADQWIFKALYGSAFRAPSWVEAYAQTHINFRAGNDAINPEETQTYEAVAIYKPSLSQKLSINAFYSDLNNVIDLEEVLETPYGYQNYDERSSKGVEVEYFYQPGGTHELYLNGTWQDTTYIHTETLEEQTMPDVSQKMFKAMHIYHAAPNLTFGTALRYFSATEQNERYSKDTTVRAQRIWDETITYHPSPTSQLRLSIKNLFDEDIRNPSYYYRSNDGDKREGRNYLLSYSQTF